MPSPFPGMDPYLEGSEWTSVHTELSSEIARQLAPKLRPKYIVRTTRRFVTEMPEDIGIVAASIYPDAGVLDAKPRTLRETRAGVTMAEPLEIATVIPGRAPKVMVKTRDAPKRELVTPIEVLPQPNKRVFPQSFAGHAPV